MKILILKRIALLPSSTLGVLFDDATPFAVTLEKPWLGNRPMISSIPKGEYLIKRTVRPKHGETFEVLDVPLRSDILIHKGNFPEDSNGCILVGESFEDVIKDGRLITSVQSSGKAYHEFYARLENQNQAKLVILEV